VPDGFSPAVAWPESGGPPDSLAAQNGVSAESISITSGPGTYILEVRIGLTTGVDITGRTTFVIAPP
jgi:hypothetical protein